jgi:ABC-2 type transport system permease protein
VIAWRELLATVRTRAFLIGIIMMPVMMLLGAGIGFITRKLEDQGEKTFAIIDRTPGEQILPILEEAARRRNERDVFDPRTGERAAVLFRLRREAPRDDVSQQRLELSDQVRKGEIAGFLEIGPRAMSAAPSLADLLAGLLKKGEPDPKPPTDPLNDPTATRYQSRPNIAGSLEFYRWAAVEISLATRLGLSSLKPEVRKAVTEQKIPVVMLGLSSIDPETGEVTDDEGANKAITRIFVGVGCIMLMFVIIFAVATPMMQGVLEEKMQRISEVLLGSVTPNQLMAGKLLGGVGVALLLAAVYVGGAYWALWHYKLADQVPASLIGWFLFNLVLALFLYGSLFMAVGAACTDMKEPQTLMLPVMIPAMLPMFLLAPILSSPDGVLARVASFFPPCTPMLMVARQALSANMAWWEPVVGSLLVLLFTAGCVWAAGRIFRVGILVQGKGATFQELFAWALRG